MAPNDASLNAIRVEGNHYALISHRSGVVDRQGLLGLVHPRLDSDLLGARLLLGLRVDGPGELGVLPPGNLLAP
jgi:hypothetical protein